MAEFITIKHCVMKLYSCEFHCIMYNDINLSGEQLKKIIVTKILLGMGLISVSTTV